MEDEQKQQATLEGQFPGENEQKKQKALKNKPERRRMLLLFMLSFLVLLVGIGSAGAFTLLTAQRGVALLEQKASAYDRLYRAYAPLHSSLRALPPSACGFV